MKWIIILFTIVFLFNSPVDSRNCYVCSCTFDWGTNSGTCDTTSFLSSCTLTNVGNQYCFITSTYAGNTEQRVFEAIAPDTFQDSHFIQAVERITLSGTIWLPTAIDSISYGCDWDGCNNMSLAQYLPESFQMKIDQTTLNSQLINGQLPAQTCDSCGKCINELTAFLCQSISCTNGFCYIDEQHNYIVTPTNNCTYNFYSSCQPFTDPVQAPYVRIRATYYIDFPQEKQLEIDEVDILCTKENCNSIVIVESLKGEIQTTIIINPDFQPSRLNDTTTPGVTASTTPGVTASTTPGVTASTTPGVTASTTPGSTSTKTYPIIFLYLVAILSLF